MKATVQSPFVHWKPKFRVLLLIVCLLTLSTDSIASAQETWRLKLQDVRVVTQRERDGDRPYFAVIQFRSRFATRNSTEVKVVCHEPHDWVSKREFRGSLPVGQTHMHRGQHVHLPFWMSEVEWRNATPLPSPFVGDRFDLARTTPAIARTEILGAVIVGLDNNNTPPHAIRNLLNLISTALSRTLQEKIERYSVAHAGDPQFQQNLESRLEAIAASLISIETVVDLAGQLTIGSTFNPDQLVGLQVLVMPALDQYPIRHGARTINLPTTVTAGPVEAHSVTRALQPWTDTWTFKGSGAEYQVRASCYRADCASLLRNLTVSMLSGDDGLRQNSSLELELEVTGREPIILPLGQGDGDRRHSAIRRTVSLPQPISRSDLKKIGIRFTSTSQGLEGHDNWTLSALHVHHGSETLLATSGNPLVRFTGQNRRAMFDVSCSAANPIALLPTEHTLRTPLNPRELRNEQPPLRGIQIRPIRK